MSFSDWKRHFAEMQQGKIHPDNNGLWRVKDYRDTNSSSSDAVSLKIVSPTQQAVEQAKTMTPPTAKRKATGRGQKKKRAPSRKAIKGKTKRKVIHSKKGGANHRNKKRSNTRTIFS